MCSQIHQKKRQLLVLYRAWAHIHWSIIATPPSLYFLTISNDGSNWRTENSARCPLSFLTSIIKHNICDTTKYFSHSHTSYSIRLLHYIHLKAFFSSKTWVIWHQKNKSFCILMKHEMMGGSGIRWTICKSSAPRSRQITTTVPYHSLFTARCPSWRPTNVYWIYNTRKTLNLSYTNTQTTVHVFLWKKVQIFHWLKIRVTILTTRTTKFVQNYLTQ